MGCSTKKNTFVSRNYHNLTSYYNVYWNGKEALNEGMQLLADQEIDNYYKILPVYQYGTVVDTQITAEKMNRVIEKATLAVKKHSILLRGVEYVKYIDDAYLLLGKAFFYKHEYSKARMVFNHVVSQFPKNPEKNEARLWVAKTYIQEKEYDMAIALLAKVQAEKSISTSLRRELVLTLADFYIEQEQYDLALPFLIEGKKLAKKKDLKSRIDFILGQIEQTKGNTQAGYKLFKECLKSNPPLVMAFNARLNIALCYDSKTMNSADIAKELLRMLKDSKNERNFGRIYFVLAEIAFKDKNENLAIDYLKKSIEVSSQDPERMLSSALRLSGYLYEVPDFIEAQKYYEIAAKVIEQEHPEYYSVQSRSENLNELLSHYNSLKENDSLAAIIKMSDSEKGKYAQELANAYIKKAEEAKKQQVANTSTSGPALSGRSNWYFYNEQTKNLGYTEFVRKWGRRELEDFWFMANKPPLAALRGPSFSSDEESENTEEAETEKELLPSDKEYYLKSMVNIPAQKQSIDSAIESALFNLGHVYFEKLGEFALAEEAFLRLLKEFPNTLSKPFVYESLCRIYKIKNNTANFKKYAKLLADEYSGSEQDQKINDPQYNEKLQANAKKVANLYETVYHYFETNASTQALELISEIENQYPINNFKAQLLYIKAISEGRVHGLSSMIPSLELFLKLYPKHELEERVTSLLQLAKSGVKLNEVPPLAENISETPVVLPSETIPADTNSTTEPDVKFTYKSNGPHFIIVLIEKEKNNPDVLKIKISDFNRKFFNTDKLTINIGDFNDKFSQLEISEFKNAKAAIDYYKSFSKNDYVFGAIEEDDRRIFIINVNNYTLLQSSKNLEAYMKFFKANYLK